MYSITGSIGRPAYCHAASFATNKGLLTDKSISTRQKELNDTGNIGDLRKRAVLSAGGENPTVQHICSFVNEARSGIWNTDGTLNVDRLKRLKSLCIDQNGTLLVTRSIFQTFIEERRASINQTYMPNVLYFGNLTWVAPNVSCPYLKIPIPYTAVTDGSVDAFFHSNSDRKLHNEDAVVWQKISEFYDPENISKLRE